MKMYHYAVNKTLMEYTGLMNLMPFLAFQISFSETQKKCSENSLEVETLSKTYSIVSIIEFKYSNLSKTRSVKYAFKH